MPRRVHFPSLTNMIETRSYCANHQEQNTLNLDKERDPMTSVLGAMSYFANQLTMSQQLLMRAVTAHLKSIIAIFSFLKN